jgi:hypothetical protein
MFLSQHDFILRDLLACLEITQSQQYGASKHLSKGKSLLRNTADSVLWSYMHLCSEKLFFRSIGGPVIEVPDRKNFLYGPRNYTASFSASLPPPSGNHKA